MALTLVMGGSAPAARAASPYGSGPGGPILIVTNAGNHFSVYYAEMLLTEGLNAFAFLNIDSISSTTLSNYDVVLMGKTQLSNGQVSILSDWVTAGGNLIVMQPDKKLKNLLGVDIAMGSLSEGYIKVNTNSGPGRGIVGETIQYHGAADRYNLAGATSVATLYSSASNSTPYHAVTLRNVGVNGGQAAAFSYELAKSVALTRQGNPAWADQNRDGDAPVRPNDLFFGNSPSDPQPDWVNLNKVAIPQADEQQRLLAKMIVEMAMDRKILPRFWYFPHGHKAVVVMTGDDHGNGGTKGRFEQYMALSPSGASVEDWEAIRATSYLYPFTTGITASEAAAFEANGFEIGLHVDTGCASYSAAQIDAFLNDQINSFHASYPGVPLPITERVHCIAWSGYTLLPEAERAFGIRFDINYYYYPASWIAGRQGFMTGSGMPMRFCKSTGEVLDIYQAPTQMTDESGQSYPQTINELLDRALGAEGYYGAFVANMHTDIAASSGSDAILASAASRGVPIVSSKQMLKWIDARNASSFGNIAWGDGVLSFMVDADSNARGLRGMVPIPPGLSVTFVTSNGVSIPYLFRQSKGVQYAEFPAFDAAYQVGFTGSVSAPFIQSLVVSNGVAKLTWASTSNSVYRLLYRNDLGMSSWLELFPDITASGMTTMATNEVGAEPQRFYRIMVVP